MSRHIKLLSVMMAAVMGLSAVSTAAVFAEGDVSVVEPAAPDIPEEPQPGPDVPDFTEGPIAEPEDPDIPDTPYYPPDDDGTEAAASPAEAASQAGAATAAVASRAARATSSITITTAIPKPSTSAADRPTSRPRRQLPRRLFITPTKRPSMTKS